MKKKKSKARVRTPSVLTEEGGGGGGAQRVCKTGLSSSDFKMNFFNGVCVWRIKEGKNTKPILKRGKTTHNKQKSPRTARRCLQKVF
jgi:hypothetical protein